MSEEEKSFSLNRMIAYKPKTAKEFLQQRKTRKIIKSITRTDKQRQQRKAKG